MFFTEIWSRLISGSSKLFPVFSYLFWSLFFYYHSWAQWKTKKICCTHTNTHAFNKVKNMLFRGACIRNSTNTKWNRLQWPTANATLRVLMMEVWLQSCDKGRATCGRADQLRLLAADLDGEILIGRFILTDTSACVTREKKV